MMKSSQAADLAQFKCPLCGKPMGGEEYTHVMEELNKKSAEQYFCEVAKVREEFAGDIQKLKATHQEEIERLKKTEEERRKELDKQLKTSYKKQLDTLRKHYDSAAKEAEKRYKDIERKLRSQHTKELRGRDRTIRQLRDQTERAKRLAKEEARAEVQTDVEKLRNDLTAKDLQIQRANTQIEGLRKQLRESQAELKGEVGELDLYSVLTKAFEDDSFKRQQRGTASGDIIQRIRISSGKLLDTPIVYDNKQDKTPAKNDIEKARKYMQIHGTKYVLIVSNHLPKEVGNGYYGEKNGVLLVHSSIVVEVARQVRNAIIEIAKVSVSAKDRETKEAKLYEYIRSQDFTRIVENLSSIHGRMVELQDKEERAHQRLWKDRKALESEINQAYMQISSSIDSIIQEKPPMEELTEEAAPEAVINIKRKRRSQESSGTGDS